MPPKIRGAPEKDGKPMWWADLGYAPPEKDGKPMTAADRDAFRRNFCRGPGPASLDTVLLADAIMQRIMGQWDRLRLVHACIDRYMLNANDRRQYDSFREALIGQFPIPIQEPVEEPDGVDGVDGVDGWHLVMTYNSWDRGGTMYCDVYQGPFKKAEDFRVTDGHASVEHVFAIPQGAALVEINDGPDKPVNAPLEFEGALTVAEHGYDTLFIIFASDDAAMQAVASLQDEEYHTTLYTTAELFAPLRQGGVKMMH